MLLADFGERTSCVEQVVSENEAVMWLTGIYSSSRSHVSCWLGSFTCQSAIFTNPLFIQAARVFRIAILKNAVVIQGFEQWSSKTFRDEQSAINLNWVFLLTVFKTIMMLFNEVHIFELNYHDTSESLFMKCFRQGFCIFSSFSYVSDHFCLDLNFNIYL